MFVVAKVLAVAAAAVLLTIAGVSLVIVAKYQNLFCFGFVMVYFVIFMKVDCGCARVQKFI